MPAGGVGCPLLPVLAVYLHMAMIVLMMVLMMMIRAHSFPRPAEFRVEPRNLGFPRHLSRGINRGIRLFPRAKQLLRFGRMRHLLPNLGLALFIGGLLVSHIICCLFVLA